MNKQKGTMSFLLYMPGSLNQGMKEELGITRKYPSPLHFPIFNHNQMEILLKGFRQNKEKLNSTLHSVTTVIGLMNLTNKKLKVQMPVLSSGKGWKILKATLII